VEITWGLGTKKKLLLAMIVGIVLLAGCDDSAKKTVQVHPPAPMPVAFDRGERLPLPASHPPAAWLVVTPLPAGDALLAKVQALYDAGQKHYQAGEFDEARESFDRAVNLVLSSSPEAQHDPQVKALFDRLADTMHTYELEAATQVQKTEDLEEDNSQPAPIDEIAGMELPPGDPRLAQRAEQELITVPHDMPITVNEAVLSYLGYFQTHRGKLIVETGLRRLGIYEPMIRRVLKEEGVPQDLMYLAQAESAFQPQAVSRAGARGIWQFMPFRGQEYDLQHTRWIDERSDPEKSTRAAARHMRDLYKIFGDWYLVMAAYNSGPLNVAKAIEHTGYADFWQLERLDALPGETRNYVPIILAMTLIAKDPARWGVHVEHDPAQKLDELSPGHPMDLHLAADVTDTSVATLRQLNPALLGFKTPEDPHFTLYLPAGTAKRFHAEMEKIPEDKWLSWRFHRMEDGETLASIARQFHVTEASLVSVNRIARDDPPAPGTALVVPAAPQADVRMLHYRVKKGDTLEGIAERFGVTATDLRRWNHLNSTHAPVGARLKIVQGEEVAPHAKQASSKHSSRTGADATEGSAVESAAPEKSKTSKAAETTGTKQATAAVEHRVKAGETLTSIARAYRTTVQALERANPFLNRRPLEVGDLLVVSPH
jgi:membrane-bound lytic murein transglycosylase D